MHFNFPESMFYILNNTFHRAKGADEKVDQIGSACRDFKFYIFKNCIGSNSRHVMGGLCYMTFNPTTFSEGSSIKLFITKWDFNWLLETVHCSGLSSKGIQNLDFTHLQLSLCTLATESIVPLLEIKLSCLHWSGTSVTAGNHYHIRMFYHTYVMPFSEMGCQAFDCLTPSPLSMLVK